MAITTLDGVIAGMQPPLQFNKQSMTSKGAGLWQSLWTAPGLPGAGSTPVAFSNGSGYVPVDSTAGSFVYTDPSSGYSYLAYVRAAGTVIGTLVVYDRLWSCSGFAANTTSAQSITTPTAAAIRYNSTTDGYKGIEIWGEIYGAPGATGGTWTVSYKNTTGATQSATYVHPSSAEAVGQMVPFTLAAGDIGVQSLISLTTNNTTTAGNVGLTLMKRLAEIPLVTANVGGTLDVVACGIPMMYPSACVALMVQCSAATTGNIMGCFGITQG